MVYCWCRNKFCIIKTLDTVYKYFNNDQQTQDFKLYIFRFNCTCRHRNITRMIDQTTQYQAYSHSDDKVVYCICSLFQYFDIPCGYYHSMRLLYSIHAVCRQPTYIKLSTINDSDVNILKKHQTTHTNACVTTTQIGEHVSLLTRLGWSGPVWHYPVIVLQWLSCSTAHHFLW